MASEEMQLQNPMFLLDGLYCEEEHFDEDLGGGGGYGSVNLENPLSLSENDLLWEDDELDSLLSKEQQQQTHFLHRDSSSDGSLMAVRKAAVDWMLRVAAHYGFAAITAVLAVNYLDRFLLSPCFEREKPWMSQLAAVACLSIAAKVEETQMHLLLDLQVEEANVVFESKTVMRMELLVLSTLQWRMNPVTPLSFLDHIMRRFGLKTHLHWEFMGRCERLLLSIINDSRILCHLPSVIATATMILVIKEVEPYNALEYQNQLMDILKIGKENVDDCYKLILELSYNHEQYQTHKRKYQCIPSSPNGVIDGYFSCDSSNDSWAVASSVSSFPEPLFKKSRAQDQPTILAPLNRVPVGVLGNPP